MELPEPEELLAIGELMADVVNAPEELGAMLAGMALMFDQLEGSDCQCDTCISLRGMMTGVESLFKELNGNQDN